MLRRVVRAARSREFAMNPLEGAVEGRLIRESAPDSDVGEG